MPTDQKHKEWQEALKKVAQITDKLGMPVDKEIAETVAILYLLGFMTTTSCAGHLGRTTGGPYVVVVSPEGEKHAQQAYAIKDPTNDRAYHELRDKANYHRATYIKRLVGYLEGFYANRQIDYRHHLIIQSMPLMYVCLMCQGSETALAVDKEEKKILLKRNQDEMREFTEYLKDLYFSENT